jgi:3-mercaptopyruvate sulfurtransferase SseA
MSTNTLQNVLVDTEWVARHATDAGVRVVEVDVDTTADEQGHVPGAAGWNWTTELCDTLVRDIVPAKKLEELLGRSGIDNKTAIVLYGDNNNWFAAQGISGDQPVIAYCRIGERSSLTWFAMKYLLGFPNVKNYDGSWTEWGNLVGAPVEKP